MSSAMLRSILFDVAFLGFGSALLLSSINVWAGMVLLAIGVLAAVARSAITGTPRSHRSGNNNARLAVAGLRTAAA